MRLGFLTSVLAATRDKLCASEARNVEAQNSVAALERQLQEAADKEERLQQVSVHRGWGGGRGRQAGRQAGRQGGRRGQQPGGQGWS